MEEDSCNFRLSTNSRSYQSALRSLSDFCLDFEGVDEDYEDVRVEYPCPFCTEDFDLVELCNHIDDEHLSEAKSGICPVCATCMGTNMVHHIITQHGAMFKSLQTLKLQKDEPYSPLSFLKKELEDNYLQSILDAPSPTVSSSKMAPDPLLSFLYNASPADKSESVQSHCSSALTLEEESSDECNFARDGDSPLSDMAQIEKGRRSKFVQGLLLSTIFDDLFVDHTDIV